MTRCISNTTNLTERAQKQNSNPDRDLRKNQGIIKHAAGLSKACSRIKIIP